MKNIKKLLISTSIISVLLTGCATTNSTVNNNVRPKNPEKMISGDKYQARTEEKAKKSDTEIVRDKDTVETEISESNIPDELYSTLFKSEVILDLCVNYNSQEPRTLNEYKLNNDIAFNLMYGAKNGWPFISTLEIQPEESILLQEKVGIVYQNKFDASEVDAVLKNIFNCSDEYLDLIKSEVYYQTEVSPSDSYIYDNGYYYFCSMMAGYDAVLNSLEVKTVRKLEDDSYLINYEASYETNVLYDNYLYRPTKRESIVMKADDDNWKIISSVFIEK